MDNEQWRMLEAAEELEDELNGWERDFVTDLLSKPDEYVLSDRQNEKLREIDRKLNRDWIR